ncbi:MAG: IS110 family transposase [Kosmotogaceae bacterium]
MEVVGIDWSKNSHACYSMEKSKSFKITDDVEGFEKLLETVTEDAVFVIEETFNRISDYLLQKERRVYLLEPKRSKEAREYHSNGLKTDKTDAISIALTYKEHPDYCTEAVYNEWAISLRELLRSHIFYTELSARLKNKLQSELHNSYPEYPRMMGRDWTDVLGYIFILTICPSINELRNKTDQEIKELLNENGLPFTKSLRRKLKRLREHATDWNMHDSTKDMISYIANELCRAMKKKKELEIKMKNELEQSKYNVIVTVPGVGTITGVSLVVAFLTHNFRNYREFQRYCGTTPIVLQSGNYRTCRMRKKCNKNLRRVLHMMALAAASKSSWMNGYYNKKKNKEGKKYAHALRALSNILVKIAFAVLRDLKPYDENRFRRNKQSQLNYTTNKGVSVNKNMRGDNERLSLPDPVAHSNCQLRTVSGSLSP